MLQDSQITKDIREGFTIRLFGVFDVQVNGHPLPSLRTRKGDWLLAYLILNAHRPVSRDVLAGILWPDSYETRALYNLRRALSDLRHELGAAAWRLDASPDQENARSLQINLSDATVDVREFDAAVRSGDISALKRAVELHRASLLEGCPEAWVIAEREERALYFLTALERLAEDSVARRDMAAAVSYLRRVLLHEPLRETALRALLSALIAVGDYPSAVQSYRDFRVRLHDELNMVPSPETRALYEKLKQELARNVNSNRSEDGGQNESLLGTLPDEPVGGAMALDSPYYVERTADSRFHEALSRGDSIVLVKGPRQVGKTSLLSRGLHRARAAGYRIAVTDLQKLTPRDLESSETLLLAFARQIASRLNLDTSPDKTWDSQLGGNENFERFLRREVLAASDKPLVWALDEVDQLFPYRFSSEVFGLFRSWHNERALDPDGPWSRLTLAMAYATEAHLFITDLNQSPFNVGTRLSLEDFTPGEVVDLNQRLGARLKDTNSLNRFYALVGGHPYLVRRGLHELVLSEDNSDLDELERDADRDEGPFGDHLRRLVFVLRRDEDLCNAVRAILHGQPCPGLWAFYRLRSAGVIIGNDLAEARPRCGLYARYLERRLL